VANAQPSRLNHSTLKCSECLEDKSKSEIFMDGFEYVCGDCK